MTNTKTFKETSSASTIALARPLAVAALLTIGVSACSGNQQTVTPAPSPQASVQDVDALLRLGDGLRQRGELQMAVAMYQRAASQSQEPEALIRLGRTLSDLGVDDQAAGAFRRALAYDPNNPDALLGVGTSYLATGEVDKSIQYLEQLLDQTGGADPIPYKALGAALDVAGRNEQAVATYTKGIELFPDDLDLKSNLAVSYALYDRQVEAIGLMIEVTDALEVKRHHHRNLVLVYALAGQDRQAVQAGRRHLGDSETRDVLAKASSLRELRSGPERAKQLNTIG
jgi:Flp pilus assembly protein TadD